MKMILSIILPEFGQELTLSTWSNVIHIVLIPTKIGIHYMNNNWVLCLRLNMSRYVSQKGVTILRRQNLKVKGGSRRHIGCKTNHIKTGFTAGSEVIQIQTRSIGESFVLCHIFPDMIDHVSLTSSIFFLFGIAIFSRRSLEIHDYVHNKQVTARHAHNIFCLELHSQGISSDDILRPSATSF